MDALEKFLSDQANSFDLDTLMSDELKRLDTTQAPSSVYKYFGCERRGFFGEPTLRFTQRTGLSDPFELMQRWRHVASDAVRNALRDNVRNKLNTLAERKSLVLEIFRQQQAKHGVFLGPREMAHAASVLLSEQGRHRYHQVFKEVAAAIDKQVDDVLAALNLQLEQSFGQLTETWGILSLCENESSRVMWDYYTRGRGFMVEFDAKHAFFAAPNGRCLLWKVNYRDEPCESFFENPMAMFLTKHSEYAFEKEWRMIKPLSECDIHDNEVHLCRVQPGMIRTITFGYESPTDVLAKDGACILTCFDSNIRLRQAIANRTSGQIEFRDLN